MKIRKNIGNFKHNLTLHCHDSETSHNFVPGMIGDGACQGGNLTNVSVTRGGEQQRHGNVPANNMFQTNQALSALCVQILLNSIVCVTET